jgi:hypothetical protein
MKMILRTCAFLSAMMLIAFSLPSFANSEACDSFLGSTRVSIWSHDNLSEAQRSEMILDVQTAISFSEKYFKLPDEVSFNVYSDNQFHSPQYSETIDRITATYQFGKMIDGKFTTNKTRRHARDILYHEFGHLIFKHNFGTTAELSRLYRAGRIKKVRQGLNPAYLSGEVLSRYIDGYNELFADVFAVLLSRNPRAMSSAQYLMVREQDLVGKFQASPREVMRARDFLNELEVESWHERQPHIIFGPARSVLGKDPYAIDLFKNDPARLSKIAFDAIHFELTRLFSEDVEILPELTVQQLNQRLIDTMKSFLEKDQEARRH